MANSYSTSSKRARLYRLTPIADRFWAKVIRADGDACWGWSGSADDDGYGQIRAEGRRGKLLKAHRVSWEIHYAAIPDGLNVLHRCDNPPCSNPAHLFLGTLAENSQDAARKGRLVYQQHPERCRRGERAHAAKLTALQVVEIRRLRAEGWTQTRLARHVGVTQAAIWFLLKGRTWKT